MEALWTYGCSFTAGDGLLENIKVECPNPGKHKHWVDYLSKIYQPTHTFNKGVGGIGNNLIFLRLLNDLTRFKPGDLIIVGQTWSEREEIHIKELTPKLVDSRFPHEWLHTSTLPIGGHSPIFEEDLFSEEFKDEIFPRDYRDIYASYYNFIMNGKTPLHRYYDAYYRTKFELLFTYLNKIGVATYLFNTPLQAPNYETITKATKGKVQDDHWSWKGSEKFGKWLVSQIKNIELL